MMNKIQVEIYTVRDGHCVVPLVLRKRKFTKYLTVKNFNGAIYKCQYVLTDVKFTFCNKFFEQFTFINTFSNLTPTGICDILLLYIYK